MAAQDVVETSLSYNNEVDVLFIVDTSVSMAKHQEELSRQTPYFLDALVGTKLDFRIAVTTMDMSRSGERGEFIGVPRVLSAATPHLYQVLEQRIAVMGDDGSAVERGKEAMKVALSREYELGSMSQFLRDEALLVLIFLTNEEDMSPEADYIGFLDSIKPPLPSGERSWVSHFIGQLPDAYNCGAFEGQYEPGHSYLPLSEASGGVTENICTADLSVAVGSIRSRVIQYITDIRLDRIPIVESISVKVDGKLVPRDEVNGWSYVSQYNLIRFNGNSIPKADAAVLVDYDPIGIKESLQLKKNHCRGTECYR